MNMTNSLHMSLTVQDSVNMDTVRDYYTETRGFTPKNSQIVKEAIAREAMRIRKIESEKKEGV